MGERELKENLEQINSEIQSTQRDIDSIQQAKKKKQKEKESENALKESIEIALASLKSLKDQRDKEKAELDS